MALKKIKLGSYAAGEIPPPIAHTFKDYRNNVLDIDGWTVLGFFIEGPVTGLGEGNCAISDGPNGEVTYTWIEADMQEPGQYKGLMWIQNLSSSPEVRLASDMFVWDVVDGPGSTPSG